MDSRLHGNDKSLNASKKQIMTHDSYFKISIYWIRERLYSTLQRQLHGQGFSTYPFCNYD